MCRMETAPSNLTATIPASLTQDDLLTVFYDAFKDNAEQWMTDVVRNASDEATGLDISQAFLRKFDRGYKSVQDYAGNFEAYYKTRQDAGRPIEKTYAAMKGAIEADEAASDEDYRHSQEVRSLSQL